MQARIANFKKKISFEAATIQNIADAPEPSHSIDSILHNRNSGSSGDGDGSHRRDSISTSLDRIESLTGSSRSEERQRPKKQKRATISFLPRFSASSTASIPQTPVQKQEEEQQQKSSTKENNDNSTNSSNSNKDQSGEEEQETLLFDNQSSSKTSTKRKNHNIDKNAISTLEYQEHEMEKFSYSFATKASDNNTNNNNNSFLEDSMHSYGESSIDSSFFYNDGDDNNELQKDGDHHNTQLPPPKGCPKCSWQVSTWIGRYAPCFWFCWKKLETGATDRSLLFRLNYLIVLFSIGQLGSSLFVSLTYYATDKPATTITSAAAAQSQDTQYFGHHFRDNDQPQTIHTPTGVSASSDDDLGGFEPNLWSFSGAILVLGILGFLLSVLVGVAHRILRQVNLAGSIRYLWTLLWVLPLEAYLVISLFDYHGVTSVYIKHHWNYNVLAWFREVFCPSGTAHNECMVPVGGYPAFGINQTTEDGENSWCMAHYNTTKCSDIRNNAQIEMEKMSYVFYLANGVWGILLCVLLVLAIHTLERIISKPIVQQSRQANIPGWLTVPTLGSFFSGYVLLFSSSSALSSETNNEVFMVGLGFLICCGLFFIAACLGWFNSAFSILNGRDKQTKLVAVRLYIGVLALTTIVLATILGACIHYSLRFKNFPIADDERGSIACAIDTSQSCSFCNNRLGLDECPEWSIEDVIKVTQAQLKGSATAAIIFITYSIATLRFGVLLQKHVLQYQIDYV